MGGVKKKKQEEPPKANIKPILSDEDIQGKTDDSEANEKKKVLPVTHKITEEDAELGVYLSSRLLKAFRPLMIMLTLFGRFPLVMKQRKEGDMKFKLQRYKPKALIFITAGVTTATIALLSGIGFMTLYIGLNKSDALNRCGLSWEEATLKRHLVPIAVFWSWIFITGCNSLFSIRYMHKYAHYFNYWSRAVQVMAMDVTDGARKGALVDIGELVIITFVLIAFYGSGMIPSVSESSGALLNAITRLFIADIGRPKIQISIFADECDLRQEVFPFEKSLPIVYKIFRGFFFIFVLYGFYGCRCFIYQFRFFCRLLSNGMVSWNVRCQNAIDRVLKDTTKQNTRRLEFKYVMKDHLILIQLVKLTQHMFKSVLLTFYGLHIICLCFQLYFLSQFSDIDSCEALFTSLASSTGKKCFDLINKTLQYTDAFFEDPCDEIGRSRIGDACVAFILFVQTSYIMVTTTTQASRAYEEAMHGFEILRRHGYMYTRTRKERNFIHSLMISYARNNPIVITGSGYFHVTKELLVVMFASVVQYYIILLQFRPGEIDLFSNCQNQTQAV